MEHRLIKGDFGRDDWAGNKFHKELCEFLGIEQGGDDYEYRI